MKQIIVIAIITFALGLSQTKAQSLPSQEQVIGNSFDSNSYQQDDDNLETTEKGAIYLSIGGAFSINTLSSGEVSSNSSWSNQWGAGFIPSFDMAYMLTPALGIGAGIKFSSYKSGFTVENFSDQLTNQFVDQDNDMYFPVYENMNLEEITTSKALEIPLFLKYKIGQGKLSYSVDLGMVFSTFLNMSYTLEGSLTRMGYYTDFNVIIFDVPEYNFDTYDYTTDQTLELDNPGLGISGFLSFNLMYELQKNILVKLGVSGSYGLTDFGPNIPSSFNNFYSTTYLGKVSKNSISIELGITYKLGGK